MPSKPKCYEFHCHTSCKVSAPSTCCLLYHWTIESFLRSKAISYLFRQKAVLNQNLPNLPTRKFSFILLWALSTLVYPDYLGSASRAELRPRRLARARTSVTPRKLRLRFSPPKGPRTNPAMIPLFHHHHRRLLQKVLPLFRGDKEKLFNNGRTAVSRNSESSSAVRVSTLIPLIPISFFASRTIRNVSVIVRFSHGSTCLSPHISPLIGLVF